MAGESNRAVKILLIQGGSVNPDKETAVQDNLALIEKGTKEIDPDFIVFSELCTTPYFCGYNDPQYFDWAEPLDGPTVKRFAETAKRLNSYILLTFFERGPVKGEFFNSLAVIDPRGELVKGSLPEGGHVNCYRKNHIPNQYSYTPGLNERYYFKGGPGLPVFDTDFGRIGCLICYERSFPEAWRVLALNGAEIVFVPTALWGPSRADSWGHELSTAAIQNGVFVVGPNKGGAEMTDGERNFFGNSLILSPTGDVLAEGPKREGPAIVTAELDLNEVTRHGVRYTFFRDRRPELYTSISQVARSVY